MRKRLLLLLAAVLMALPLGAGVAMAQGGGNSNDVSGDTGEACPESSPQGAEEDPSCGEEGNGGGGEGETGKACPPESPDADGDGKPRCGDGEDDDTEHECNDGVDNDGDGAADGADTNDCQDGDTSEDTPVEAEHECNDGVDNDGDGAADGADTNDCQDGDTTEDTPVGGGGGDDSGRCHAPNSLSAAGGHPLGEFDTIGHELWEGGLQVSPLTEHPDADGEVTGQLYDGAAEAPSPVKEVVYEVACLGDLLIDSEAAGGDL